MMDSTPIVLVFAGPNGSGKSTATKGFDIIGEYINADGTEWFDKLLIAEYILTFGYKLFYMKRIE